MKNFFGEFKKFIQRGSVLDMAVGVVIGGAFTAIINAIVQGVLMPVIGLLTGGVDFSQMFVYLKDTTGLTTEELEAVPKLMYGNVISAIISFILIALVLFLVIKAFNKAKDAAAKKEAEAAVPAEPTTKVCPFCKSEIPILAVRCPHCTSELPAEE